MIIQRHINIVDKPCHEKLLFIGYNGLIKKEPNMKKKVHKHIKKVCID